MKLPELFAAKLDEALRTLDREHSPEQAKIASAFAAVAITIQHLSTEHLDVYEAKLKDAMKAVLMIKHINERSLEQKVEDN